MPREVSDIKQFIEICRRKDASCMAPHPHPPQKAQDHRHKINKEGQKADGEGNAIAARIKRNRKSQQIKFKVRCHRFLYTLVLKDSDKADKLKQSLPPGLKIEDVPKRNKKGKREAA
ncbi:MAG: hypothetical protein Q9194_005007 [Teloschistes cf. exilis]